MCSFFCCLGWAGERVFFLLFGRVACSFFCCLGGGVFFFLLFGRGRVLFLLFGRGRVVFFAVWAAGVFYFLLFGRGTGVHSLTRLPGSSLSDPRTKETEQQNKNTGSHPGLYTEGTRYKVAYPTQKDIMDRVWGSR